MKGHESKTTKMPDGYTARPAVPDDLASAAELINICWKQRIGRPLLTADELYNDLTRPSVDLSRDTLLVFSSAGDLVGYAAFFINAPYVQARVRVEVHPNHHGRGIGTVLAGWAESRGQSMSALAPSGTRLVLLQETLSTDETSQRLLEAFGYRLVRHDFEMLINMDTPPETPVVPKGIIIRPCKLPEEERAVVDVIRQSFKGHWGYVEQPFEDDLKEWGNFFYKAPNCDPELLLVALENDRLIGTCFGVPNPADSPYTGWVFALGVLPGWRRRGLGLALLQYCFVELYRRGKTKVSLAVDAENLSGATQLYEKAGMHITYRHDIFERELRPGEELS